MGSEGDADRLFKTEGKDLSEALQKTTLQTSCSTPSLGPTQMFLQQYWDTWDGNDVDGDRSMLEVGLPTPLSGTYHLDFGGSFFLHQQSVQSRVIEVTNAHVRPVTPASFY